MMRGLRIYTPARDVSPRGGGSAFISRREDGPFYCWHDGAGPGRWYVSRVPREALPRLVPLSSADLPSSLRARLREHYGGDGSYFSLSRP
jgi:hypothetical protein